MSLNIYMLHRVRYMMIFRPNFLKINMLGQNTLKKKDKKTPPNFELLQYFIK